MVKPTKPIVIVDAEIYDEYENELMEIDRQTMLANLRAHGVTIAEADDTDADVWRGKGYLVLNRCGSNHLGELKEGDTWDISYDLYEIDPEDAQKQEINAFGVAIPPQSEAPPPQTETVLLPAVSLHSRYANTTGFVNSRSR